MVTSKLEYLLSVRSKPDPCVSVIDKHQSVTQQLLKLPTPWGLQGRTLPDLKVRPGDLYSIFHLRGLLGRGIKGNLSYTNRNWLTGNEAACDDWITLEFDCNKVDYDALVGSAFGSYVLALGAYTGWVQSKELMLAEFEHRIDNRRDVYR